MQLLTELLPNSSSFSVWNSRFSDIRSIVSKDDRFYAVQEEETREDLQDVPIEDDDKEEIIFHQDQDKIMRNCLHLRYQLRHKQGDPRQLRNPSVNEKSWKAIDHLCGPRIITAASHSQE